MNATLQECRAGWEKGLKAMAERMRDNCTLLVVLKRTNDKYDCHRYMFGSMVAEATKGEDLTRLPGWDVSVDARDVDADTAIKWCLDPKALRTGIVEEIECESCRGYGYFDKETEQPTLDRNGRKCLDCRGMGTVPG